MKSSDYAGSCAVCLTGTDTGISFEGEPDWLVAGLNILGVPYEQAVATVDPNMPPLDDHGRARITYRVCQRCVKKCPASFPNPKLLISAGTIPVIHQPGGA